MMKIMVMDKEPTDERLKVIAHDQSVRDLCDIHDKIMALGPGPANISNRFKRVVGFEWVTLDYNIHEVEKVRENSYYGEIYDTVTGVTLWRGNNRRRRRDTERITNTVLDILDDKFGS